MRKININSEKWERILHQHYEYCVSKLPQDTRLNEEEKKLLFIKYPFNKKMKIKREYLSLRKNDFTTEYNNFTIYKKEWCRYKFIESLGLIVCPYCGQQYFSTVKKTDTVIAEAELDHYARKSRYPFLALNIYNLIPVCKNCNKSFKLNSDRKIINPYKYNLEEFLKFSIENAEISNYMNDSKISLNIETLVSDHHELFEFIDNHKNVLCLKERYEFYQSLIKSLIYKKVIYNNANITDLFKLINQNGKIVTEETLKNMLVYQDILNNNEPFSKLKTDIWKQLEDLEV